MSKKEENRPFQETMGQKTASGKKTDSMDKGAFGCHTHKRVECFDEIIILQCFLINFISLFSSFCQGIKVPRSTIAKGFYWLKYQKLFCHPIEFKLLVWDY